VSETALILDFDGVVVDTERLWLPIWAEVAKRWGLEISAETSARTPGKPNRRIVAELFASFPDDVQDRISAEVYALGRAAIDAELRMMPGVEGFLRRRAGKMRIALATNSGRKYIDEMTGRLGLTGCFNPVVCGEGALRPKPEPDIYLHVLKQLEMPADRCVVVEDSIVGVRAAKAAGLRVVALAGTFPRSELAELADDVMDGWHEADGKLP